MKTTRWSDIKAREKPEVLALADAKKNELNSPEHYLSKNTLTKIYMSNTHESSEYPYATHLNIHYESLQVIDVPALIAACTDRWYNQTLCQVNDSVIRLGVMQGEYHWHKHDDLDEFFFVLEGHFLIDLENRTIDLGPQQGFVVPKGVVHRTRAPEKAVIIMVEGVGIVPTGD